MNLALLLRFQQHSHHLRYALSQPARGEGVQHSLRFIAATSSSSSKANNYVGAGGRGAGGGFLHSWQPAVQDEDPFLSGAGNSKLETIGGSSSSTSYFSASLKAIKKKAETDKSPRNEIAAGGETQTTNTTTDDKTN